MRALRLLLLAPLAVSACVAPPAPPPAPRPVPQPAPQPPSPTAPAVDWADRTPASGLWTYSQDARGSIAMYGQAGGDALFTLRCDRTGRRIYASRPGTVAARMTLRSTNGARAYAALPTGGTPPYVAATLAPTDPQLDAMAFSRGRILIGLDGADDLILPIWPEFTRVVEDCRG
jgi:hypothetical protein